MPQKFLSINIPFSPLASSPLLLRCLLGCRSVPHNRAPYGDAAPQKKEERIPDAPERLWRKSNVFDALNCEE